MKAYVSLDDLFELVSVIRNNPSMSHQEILEIAERLPKILVDLDRRTVVPGPPSALIQFKSGDLYEFMLRYKKNQDSLGRGYGKLFGFTILDIVVHNGTLTIKYLDESNEPRTMIAEKGGTQTMPQFNPP